MTFRSEVAAVSVKNPSSLPVTALALSARRPFGLARGLDKNSTCAANNQETDNDNDAIDNENDDSDEAHISGLVGNYLDNSEEWRDLEN